MCNLSNCAVKDVKRVRWKPCLNLFSHTALESHSYAIIILNTPLQFGSNPRFLVDLWNNAQVRITVDGGTDRWLRWMQSHGYLLSSVMPPDLVTGDLDSVSAESLQLLADTYQTKIIKTPDQNKTDFTKALYQLSLFFNVHCLDKVETVYVVVETCGRIDQILANINTLLRANDILPGRNVFQLSSESLTWILREGHHLIDIPVRLRITHEWCSLLPIGGPVRAKTAGLKWNLDNTQLEFGELISTSNTYADSSMVLVCTNKPVVWSMGIGPLCSEYMFS